MSYFNLTLCTLTMKPVLGRPLSPIIGFAKVPGTAEVAGSFRRPSATARIRCPAIPRLTPPLSARGVLPFRTGVY